MNIFEQATRKKLRFDTPRGIVDVETLWQMPLEAPCGYALDDVAKAVNARLKAAEEDSFVKPSKLNKHADENLRLEVLKHIIGVKLQEAEAQEQAKSVQTELATLQTAMARRRTADLESLSAEELQARIDKLSTKK